MTPDQAKKKVEEFVEEEREVRHCVFCNDDGTCNGVKVAHEALLHRAIIFGLELGKEAEQVIKGKQKFYCFDCDTYFTTAKHFDNPAFLADTCAIHKCGKKCWMWKSETDYKNGITAKKTAIQELIDSIKV